MENTYFYDVFSRLCREKGEKPSNVVTKIGLSTPNATYWKRGSIPKYETMKKLAEYFSVPVETFLDLSNDERIKIEMSSMLIQEMIGEYGGDPNSIDMDAIRSHLVDVALNERTATREIGPYEKADKILLDAYSESSDEEIEEELLKLYHSLNRRGRIESLERLAELSSNMRYSLKSYVNAFYSDFLNEKIKPQDQEDPEAE